MELNFITTVIKRSRADFAASLFTELDVPLVISMLATDIDPGDNDFYELESEEKSVIVAVADGEKTQQLLKNMKRKLFIDIPGNGIVMVAPIKSVGGGKTLAYLTNNSVSGGTVPDMTFDYELILIILNHSYTDDVMDVARAAGASGGTVLHAKGTGARYAQKFFGVSLANEKEVIMIAAKASQKTGIMQAIAENAGPETPAGAITFSLPLSSVAGIRDIKA